MGDLKGLLPSINNLSRGIQHTPEDKIRESVIFVRKEKKKKSYLLFPSILQLFQRGVVQKISHFNKKVGPNKAG